MKALVTRSAHRAFQLKQEQPLLEESFRRGKLLGFGQNAREIIP